MHTMNTKSENMHSQRDAGWVGVGGGEGESEGGEWLSNYIT